MLYAIYTFARTFLKVVYCKCFKMLYRVNNGSAMKFSDLSSQFYIYRYLVRNRAICKCH